MSTIETRTAWDSFSGLAETYECRPPYPRECIHEANRRLHEGPAGAVVEVGAGTGTFTRTLAATLDPASPILAIEPNADMREHAFRITPRELRIQYRDGIAEKLPAGDHSVKLLVAAAAAQRFDRPAFYAEAARALRPGGLLLLVHNNPRDLDSPFFSEYLTLLEHHAPAYKRGRRTARDGSYQEVDFLSELSASSNFEDVELLTWKLDELVDREKLTQLVLSSTILAPALRASGRESILSEAWQAFDRFVDNRGRVHMPYLTEAVFARRRAGVADPVDVTTHRGGDPPAA